MKIVAVLGSPRPQGNSAGLAQRLLDAAEGLGAEVQRFFVNKMEFKGCQGCEECKTKSDRCVLEDELTPVLEVIKQADALVLASPVYFGDISGRLKCFFDRTYSYLNTDFSSRLPRGKKAVMVLVQAQPEESEFNDIFPRYERWLRLYGFAPVHLLRATGVKEPGDIDQQGPVLKKAAALARDLVRPAAKK